MILINACKPETLEIRLLLHLLALFLTACLTGSPWHVQVTPAGKGATWMSARMSPACHFFKVDGCEQILVVGGRVFDQERLQATPTAVVIETLPGPPVHSFEEKYRVYCVAHMADKTTTAGHELAPALAGGPSLVSCTSADMAFCKLF